LPFDGIASGTRFTIGGRPAPPVGQEPTTKVRVVMPGYFQTMGIPLKSGRTFEPTDNSPETPYRFVVNDTFVRRHFAGEEPLGKRISVNMEAQNPLGEIIGVVGDVKEGALDQDPMPTVYYIHAHLTNNALAYIVRTANDPVSLTEPIRRVVRSKDAALPMTQVRTMEAIVRETFSRQRFSTMLLMVFSGVSLLLAAVGIYGVLAYSVTARTRELGVRMALGAEPRRITGLVIGGAAWVVVPGILAGGAGALALTGLLKTMLYGVKPHDAVSFLMASVVLAAVAMAAAYLPARRASKIMPLDALRME